LVAATAHGWLRDEAGKLLLVNESNVTQALERTLANPEVVQQTRCPYSTHTASVIGRVVGWIPWTKVLSYEYRKGSLAIPARFLYPTESLRSHVAGRPRRGLG